MFSSFPALTARTRCGGKNITTDETSCALAGLGSEPCTENISLPFSFPWFGDTSVTEIAVASNGQLTIDAPLATSRGESIVIGGSVRFPQIVINADVSKAGKDFYEMEVLYMPLENSVIILWESTPKITVVNGQIELFIDGTIEMRWGAA